MWFWLLRVRVPSATRLCKPKIASFNASDSWIGAQEKTPSKPLAFGELKRQDCFDLALTAVYVSQQFWQDTNVGNTQIPKAQISPYKTFNLSGDWYLTKRLRLIAGISNLTDEKYYDRVFANGIEPAPRRSGYAGLSLAF